MDKRARKLCDRSLTRANPSALKMSINRTHYKAIHKCLFTLLYYCALDTLIDLFVLFLWSPVFGYIHCGVVLMQHTCTYVAPYVRVINVKNISACSARQDSISESQQLHYFLPAFTIARYGTESLLRPGSIQMVPVRTGFLGTPYYA